MIITDCLGGFFHDFQVVMQASLSWSTFTPAVTEIKGAPKPKVGDIAINYLLDEKWVYMAEKLFCPPPWCESNRMMSLFSTTVTPLCYTLPCMIASCLIPAGSLIWKKKVWLIREERKTRKNWLMILMLWTCLHFQSEIDTCIKTLVLQVWKPEGKKVTPIQWVFFLYVKSISVWFP